MIAGPGHAGLWLKLFLLISILLCAGCSYFQSTSVPIQHQYFNYEVSNTTLVLLLPGFGDSPKHFIKHETVEQIMECRPDVNIIGVDSHFGYYKTDTIIERLHDDIIGPAKAAGIKQIWLMGISMGGIGSLIYRQAHPDDLTAIILMAPYVGSWGDLTLYQNQPEQARKSVSPKIISLWDGLMATATDDPAITLASGADDSSSKQHNWLAGLIGSNHVITAPGGHQWEVWKSLWPQALQLSGLCTK